MSLHASMTRLIARHGPITVAEFMDRALYDPEAGYYARAARRSGRSGDFHTSVDVGPLFGQLLATLFARLWRDLRDGEASRRFTLVEAAASDGRLTRDVLDTLASESPECYEDCEVVLVERSASARAAQVSVLGPHAPRVTAFADELPDAVHGVVFANELLDAMPYHRLRATAAGWRELYVDAVEERLVLREGPVSSPDLAGYFDRLGVAAVQGQVADVSPDALRWVRGACRAIEKGWLLLIDYGHEAREIFSLLHAEGTLRSYSRHLVDAPPASGQASAGPAWLLDPGDRDITAHVDFTSVRLAVEDEGCQAILSCAQGRFLAGLGLAERLAATPGDDVLTVRRRLAAKALVLPGGLGSTHRVLLAGKGVAGRGGGVGGAGSW